MAASAGNDGGADTSAPPAEEDGGDDAPGYIWGMNVVTGKSREEEEAEAAASAKAAAEAAGGASLDEPAERKRPRGKLVELRYGSYQGMQLSVGEVRRIKAEECRALLARRKLVRTRGAPNRSETVSDGCSPARPARL